MYHRTGSAAKNNPITQVPVPWISGQLSVTSSGLVFFCNSVGITYPAASLLL
jgi:hypothetical protein